MPQTRLLTWAITSLLSALPLFAAQPPAPKEGVLVPKNKAVEIRAQVLALQGNKVLARIQEDANKAVAEWPQAKPEIEKQAHVVKCVQPHIVRRGALWKLHTLNDMSHYTGVTLFAPKAGSYSTKMR